MILILIILIIILLVYLLFSNNKMENMGNYMNGSDLYMYLIEDKDNYYKNFSEKDLKVRNVKNIEEYHNNIKEACCDIDDNIANILSKCIIKANNKLRKYNSIGFDGNKCADIPWNVGIIKDKLYEEGYPHTRNNIIIIPLHLTKHSNQLTNTLIHEKIHVYQKTYPEDINKYLEANGFTKYKLRKDINNIGIYTRANPDMDEWIYKNKDNEIMMAEYYENPKSIMDVNIKPTNNSSYEHPFEYMAYNITSNINQ